MFAAAMPAAAKPAPLRNFRRPASIIFGQLVMISSLLFALAALRPRFPTRLSSGHGLGAPTTFRDFSN